jgi:type II secretory pathway pseudopilin PulG
VRGGRRIGKERIAVKNKKSAFTLVEALAVMGIIAILVMLLIPALTTVRKIAKETQQKAQITTIEMALTAFRNDYGEYPPSHGYDASASDNIDYTYTGTQTLAEALVGWDLMGFHPKSAWKEDGKDKSGGDTAYTGATTGSPSEIEANLKARRGPYLEATTNVFRLGDLYTTTSTLFNLNTFVICDVFGVKSVTVGGKVVKAGTPILYYRANTSSKTIDASVAEEERIYNRKDNYLLVYYLEKDTDNPLCNPTMEFYDYIKDQKVTTVKWPSRPDSYLLVSAGADGLYGTKDDICNFDPNVPG